MTSLKNGEWTQFKEAKGNMSLIALIDTSEASAGSLLHCRPQSSMFPAFEHFGMPYQILDLREKKLCKEDVFSHSCIVIAQESLGRRLSSQEMSLLIDAVNEGVGLVNFDSDVAQYSNSFREALGMFGEVSAYSTPLVRVCNDTHYITGTRELGETIEFKRPVEIAHVEALKNAITLLRSAEGVPAVFATRSGKGKAVQFAISPKVWLDEYLGHASGLDDIFWKSIVWAAKKPFLMMAMPPFVTCQFDDCYGSSNPFKKGSDSAVVNLGYIDVLNEFGYVPHVSFFIDQVDEKDERKIKEKYDKGLAEFSAHAFAETLDFETAHFIYQRTHGFEYTYEELDEIFAKVDEKFRRWGIVPSKVVDPHWQNPGLRSLRYLKERGQTYVMFNALFGMAYSDPCACLWRNGPYGKHDYSSSYVFDYIPIPQDFPDAKTGDFFIVQAYLGPDFLGGKTVFNNENKFNDIDAAADKAALQIKRGLDSLFFGNVMCHEQRIAALSLEEWRAIFTKVEKLTSKYHKIHKSYEYIAQYAKNKCDCRIVEAVHNLAEGKVSCILKGGTDMPLQVYVFRDKNEGVEYHFETIPPFKESVTVSYQLAP